MPEEKEYLFNETLGDRQVHFRITKDAPWNLELHLYSDSFSGQLQLYTFGGEQLEAFAKNLLAAIPKINTALNENNVRSNLASLERQKVDLEARLAEVHKSLEKGEEVGGCCGGACNGSSGSHGAACC